MFKKLILGAVIVAALLFIIALGGYKLLLALKRAQTPPPPPPKPLEEVTITTIEGWTVQEVAEYLDKKGVAKTAAFEKAIATIPKEQYKQLSTIPKAHTLEGFLFPDTYRILKGASSEDVIDKMLANFFKKLSLAEEGVQKTGERYLLAGYNDLKVASSGTTTKLPGLSLYDVITLASIVERETGRDVSNSALDQKERLDAERKVVAGIFLNRLAIGMALESDATVNYATGKHAPSASSEDLEVKSPYNTYRNAGLPPGPIGNPSFSSIEAVLHPTKTDYYYFLHKQPSGEVVYSKTFEEHKQNKFKYLR